MVPPRHRLRASYPFYSPGLTEGPQGSFSGGKGIGTRQTNFGIPQMKTNVRLQP